MEHRSRLRLLAPPPRRGRRPLAARLWPALGLLLGTLGATEAVSEVYTTRARALAEAFPGARIEARSFVLDDRDVKSIQELARVKVTSRLTTAYLAWRNDSLAGTAFIDSRTVRTMPGVFLVVVAPDTTIERIEVLAFYEPPDYLPVGRWLDLFARHSLDEGLWPRRDIRNLSGATLSTRAVTESARLGLALYRTLVAPAAQAPAPAEAR